MTRPLRKLALTAHVAVSVGWLGSVAAYIALPIMGLSSEDPQSVRAAYMAMDLIGWNVIVPCCLATLLTGLVQSLGTEWGLVRHYWVLAKLLLTVVGTIILLAHMPLVSRMADIAATTTLSATTFSDVRLQLLVHAAGGLLVLLTATVLSIYKPWGRTPFRRGLAAQGVAPRTATVDLDRVEMTISTPPSGPDTPGNAGVGTSQGATPGRPWQSYVLIGLIVVIVLFVVFHLAGGGMRMH